MIGARRIPVQPGFRVHEVFGKRVRQAIRFFGISAAVFSQQGLQFRCGTEPPVIEGVQHRVPFFQGIRVIIAVAQVFGPVHQHPLRIFFVYPCK